MTFVRTDDIPVLCAEGAIDLGITGSDLLAEARMDGKPVTIKNRLKLGVGACRLAICVPTNSPVVEPKDLAGDRIATSFPNVTRDYLNQHGVSGHIVELTGSVEVMIALGVADAIVDLVETGSTLAANQLRILDEIGQYETVLIQNPRTPHADLCDRITRRLEGVVIARSYSLLEYNVAEAKLAAAEKVTPGFSSPTVNKLEKPGWYAVRAMVKRGEVIEHHGAAGIAGRRRRSWRPASATAGYSRGAANSSPGELQSHFHSPAGQHAVRHSRRRYCG